MQNVITKLTHVQNVATKITHLQNVITSKKNNAVNKSTIYTCQGKIMSKKTPNQVLMEKMSIIIHEV